MSNNARTLRAVRFPDGRVWNLDVAQFVAISSDTIVVRDTTGATIDSYNAPTGLGPWVKQQIDNAPGGLTDIDIGTCVLVSIDQAVVPGFNPSTATIDIRGRNFDPSATYTLNVTGGLVMACTFVDQTHLIAIFMSGAASTGAIAFLITDGNANVSNSIAGTGVSTTQLTIP